MTLDIDTLDTDLKNLLVAGAASLQTLNTTHISRLTEYATAVTTMSDACCVQLKTAAQDKALQAGLEVLAANNTPPKTTIPTITQEILDAAHRNDP